MFNVPPALLSLPDAINTMVKLLEGIRYDLAAQRAEKPPERPAANNYWYAISSAGNKQSLAIPIEGHITGLLIGGDTAGRGVLQIDQRSYPFWIPANATVYFPLGIEDQLVVKNEKISYVQPTGGTNWDVTIIASAR